MYSNSTEWLKVATEGDRTEKYSVWVPKKLTPYGGTTTGSHVTESESVTAWINAAVQRLFIQLFIDKQLCIRYNYNHVIHQPYILETFAPVTPSPHLQ